MTKLKTITLTKTQSTSVPQISYFLKLKKEKVYSSLVLHLSRVSKKHPRLLTYGNFLLIVVCFIFLAAAYSELATVKQTAQPSFIHQYCSYNFRHNLDGCGAYMRELNERYFFDALRFLSVPFAVFIIWFVRGNKKSIKVKNE